MVIEADIDTIDHQTLMIICDVHAYLVLYGEITVKRPQINIAPDMF